jgi:hypothetical protein
MLSCLLASSLIALRYLALRFSPYSPEGTQAEPGKRNGEADCEHQTAWAVGMARLVLCIFADTGHGSYGGHRQKDKSGDFQPELMEHAADRTSGLAHSGQNGAARTVALYHGHDSLNGGTKGQRLMFFTDWTAVMIRSVEWVVTIAVRVQPAESLTTKATKVHEGIPDSKAFVILGVLRGSRFCRLPSETAAPPDHYLIRF